MKIGVALSGCDIGGVGAHHVLDSIRGHGLDIAMISCCCLPAVTALAYAYGYTQASADKLAARFLQDAREHDLDMAVGNIAASLTLRKERKRAGIVLNAADLTGGGALLFTDDLELDAANLRTIPLDDAYDALSATVSGVRGLCSYKLGGHALCNYSAQYGNPVAPLRMLGYKVLCVSFLPRTPGIAYEAVLKRAVLSSAGLCDLFVPVEFDGELPLDACIGLAVATLGRGLREGFDKLLF